MASMLQQYMQNYGPKLQSQLAPSTAANGAVSTQPVVGEGMQTSALGTNPGDPLQVQSGGPGAAAPPAAQAPVAASSELESAAGGDGGEDWSFKGQWQRMPEADREKETDKLAAVLQKGGRTIDTAFDDMVGQLGTRPSGKLSRQDKGMLLMEFGLSLMANSARTRHLGGAIGASGLQTMQSYQQMTNGRQQAYDAKKQSIDAERTKAKSRLAEDVTRGEIQSVQQEGQERARAERDASQERARSEREGSMLSGTVTGEDGSVYGYTRGGRASALKDESGKPIKERQKPISEPLVQVQQDDGSVTYMPRSEAVGKKRPTPTSQLDKPFAMKATDTNSIYRQAAGLFGGMYDPMTGRIGGLNREQAQTVQGIASRASQIYMEGGGQVDHATAVDQAFKERRGGSTRASKSSALEPRQYGSQQEVQAALERGEVQADEIVVVNGQRFRIQQ